MTKARPGATRPSLRRPALSRDRRKAPATTSFPVVGVGASAGGLEAFRQLLAHVPADSGLALVLVQHLQPRRASELCDALRGATRMKVGQARDGVRIEPNQVYVVPPGAQMGIEQGVLRVTPNGEVAPSRRLPVDHFFRSLAAERGRRAIGVVLSGTASDGTEGLAAIRAHGGITLAQEPASARFGQMPQGAIDAGVVDLRLPVPALGDELLRLARHPYLTRREALPLAPWGAALLASVLDLVRDVGGVDFGEYRPAAVKRRVARRMAVRGAKDAAGYLKLLQVDAGEVRSLHDDLLARATPPFQDRGSLEELADVALGEVLRRKADGAPLRAWVVGCATGEAVYSLAMSIVERLAELPSAHPVQVFGSDLGDRAIEQARAGRYSEGALGEVGEERRSRFFARSEGGWRVDQKLRDLCVFARHDLARDPPFSRLDLVICRGVLPHFGHALQKRVLGSLHHALNDPGYLLLGRGEHPSAAPRLFAAAAPGGGLFARRAAAGHLRLASRDGAVPVERAPRARAAQPGPSRPGQRRPGGQRAPADTELLSLNEELQTANEELETAQEELQATNEQLTTLSDELSSRNRELELLNADLVNLFATVEIPIVMLDANQRLRRFTPQAGALLNLTSAALGKPLGNVALDVHAPDLELWIAQALRTGAMVEAEVQDRSARWHRMQIRPHRAPDGRTDGTLLTLVDIHELKHHVADAVWERDYARSIVEAVRFPLVVLDGQLSVLSANQAFCTGFGATAPEIEGQGFFEIGGGWDSPELRRSLERVLAEGARFQGLEMERDLPGAGRRTLSLSARRVPSRTSARVALLVIEDITERVKGERLRAELLKRAEQAQQLAEQANRAKDEFLGILSHELRTPLTSLLLQAELLRSSGLDPDRVRRASASVERSARLQLRLVEQLLDVSSIIAGKLGLEEQWVDLAPVVLAALELVKGPAEAKALRVQAEVGVAIPAFRGDPARLQQVVANLLVNSIKATPDGGQLRVTLERLDGAARITVADTGRGIDPRFLPHVFDRFAQEAGSRSRGHGGLGLGLAISRHIVELHGGTIRAESAGRDLGATFTVTLPLRDAVDAPPPDASGEGSQAAGAPAAADAPRLAAVRVLVVDDDDAREAVAELLAREGAEVRTCASAGAGLAAVETFRPDVVLCDIAMPGEDGYAFVGRLRALDAARGGGVPAVAFTALAGERERERCLAAGFQAHLAKPATTEGVLGAVLSVLAPGAAGQRPRRHGGVPG